MRRVAYTIDDPDFPNFEVMATAHGWWMEIYRVVSLIASVKTHKTLTHAWEAAGITEKEWRNFIKAHPTFNRLRKDYWWQKKYRRTLPNRQASTPVVTSGIECNERVFVYETASVKIVSSPKPVPDLSISVQDQVPIEDGCRTVRQPDMDGLYLQIAHEKEIARARMRENSIQEAHRQHPTYA